jgi:hypothetical protein
MEGIMLSNVMRATAFCGALAGAASFCASASAQLLDPGLDGPAAPVTTIGPGSAWISSITPGAWYQFTVVPGGSLTSSFLPSTDSLHVGGSMIRIDTNSGDWPPAEQGNGFGQTFIGGESLPHATVSFDINVLSGHVTGGITKDIGGGIGVFTPDEPSFGPTGGWIHVVDHADPGTLSNGVFFETLTLQPDYPNPVYSVDLGGNYEIANIQVSVPEPASWMMLLAGFAGLAFACRRASQKNSPVAL